MDNQTVGGHTGPCSEGCQCSMAQMKEIAKEYNQGHGHINQQVCPQCGYCPCCGRPGGNWNYPKYPIYPSHPNPNIPMYQVWSGGTGGQSYGTTT